MLADICVVAVVALFVCFGYRAGLMKSFIRLASYLISIVASFFLYPIVSDILVKTPIYTKLTETISQKYVMENFADKTSVNSFGIFSKYIGDGIQSAANGIAEATSMLLVNLLAFLIILIISRIIIRVAAKMLGIFTKLPVIKQFNRLGGGVFGGIAGVLVLYIVSAVMLIASPIESGSRVAQEIESSAFASEIYENNIILSFIGKGK